MNKEAIKRLENNHYAIDKSYQNLKKAIDNNYEQDIYCSIGETLLWVLVTDEWHKDHDNSYVIRRNNDKDGVILLGLRHAYNMVKHNMNIMRIHNKQGGFTFPLEFPLVIEQITVHWMEAGNKLEGRFRKQKRKLLQSH